MSNDPAETPPETLPVRDKDEAMPARGDPQRLIELAITQGADVDKLERLMDLEERWRANKAREAYYHAIATFQSRVPRLRKTKHVDAGPVRYDYTPLSDIGEQLKDVLRECRLSYRWEIEDAGEYIKVNCIVTHEAGHSEATAMCAPPDDSGKKNAVQQRGSTITYLQRYTLIGALGLTTADSDIDARMHSGETISEEQAMNLEALLTEVGADRPKFLKWLGVDKVSDCPAHKYSQAIKMLEKKRKQ